MTSARFHHRKLPEVSALLSGVKPSGDVSFYSEHLQIWFNRTEESWVGNGEVPHKHLQSDECFIVLLGTLVVEVEGRKVSVGPGEFCCFPAGVYHAILEVHPPVETFMVRAPSVSDKVYQASAGEHLADSR